MKSFCVVVILTLISVLPAYAGKWSTGTTAPATCTVGDSWTDTNGTADNRFYTCTATNTWTLNSNQTAIDTKANSSAFASAAAFESAFGWAPGSGSISLSAEQDWTATQNFEGGLTVTGLTATLGALSDVKFGSDNWVDDTKTSGNLNYLWSSKMVFDQLALKSDTTHNHTGVYEPADANIIKVSEVDSLAEFEALLGWSPGSGGSTPTIQADDPTSASATGWYAATGSGDIFYKSDNGLFTIAGIYTADPVTYTATLTITDASATGDTFTLNSIAYDVADSPVSVTDLPTATEQITYTGSNTANCTGDVTGTADTGPWAINADPATVGCVVTVESVDYCADKLGTYSLYYDADHPEGTTTACISGGTTVATLTAVAASTDWNTTAGGAYGVLYDGASNHYLSIPATYITPQNGRLKASIKFPAVMPSVSIPIFEWGTDVGNAGVLAYLQYSATGAGGLPGFRMVSSHYDGATLSSTGGYVASTALAGTTVTYIVDWSSTTGLIKAWAGAEAITSISSTIADFSVPSTGVLFGELIVGRLPAVNIGYDDIYEGGSQQ